MSSGLERIFDNVRRLQSKAGQAQAETLVLRGNIEADATCIRKCPVQCATSILRMISHNGKQKTQPRRRSSNDST